MKKPIKSPVVEIESAPTIDPNDEFGPIVSAPVEKPAKLDERVTFKVQPYAMPKIEMSDKPIVDESKVEQVSVTGPKIVRVPSNTLAEMEAGRKSIERFK